LQAKQKITKMKYARRIDILTRSRQRNGCFLTSCLWEFSRWL